jgi:hypothetical protein
MWGPYPSLVTPVSSLPLTIPREGADILRIPFHQITIIVSSTRHNCSGEVALCYPRQLQDTVDESLSTFISHQRLATVSVNTTSQQMPTILDTRNGTGDKNDLNLLICLVVCLVREPSALCHNYWGPLRQAHPSVQSTAVSGPMCVDTPL